MQPVLRDWCGELSPLLRPIAATDVADVLALNERNVDLLAPLDAARLEQITAWSHRADVIEVDGEFSGFVITIGPGTAYDSPNYRCSARCGRDVLPPLRPDRPGRPIPALRLIVRLRHRRGRFP